MFIIRPIRTDDIEKFYEFANKAQVGITSLPRDQELLKKKIQHSLQSFRSVIANPQNEYYLFVLEDISTGQVGGISAIQSVSGTPDPLYFFEIHTLSHPRPLRTLESVTIRHGPSEICTLYLDPSFRKGGLGRLLSLSRFLFIDSFPMRFTQTLFANMRGIIDQSGNAPFWDGIGRNFLNMNFAQVQMLLAKGRDFIPDILPQYPIYIDLLPIEIQNVIGKVYENTLPALNMLLDQGFTYTNQVDIFDGGPKIAVERDHVKTIQHRKTIKVQSIMESQSEEDLALICNHKLDFRACLGYIREGSIDRETAKALQIEPGEEISYVPKKDPNGRSLHP